MTSRGSSLMQHLLVWALGALAVVWLGFMAVGVQTGLHESDELTDGHLASVSALLLRQQGGVFTAEDTRPLAGVHDTLKSHDYQQSLSVVVWDAAGRVLTHTGVAALPAFTPDEGFVDLRLGPLATQWRGFARWDADGPNRTRRVLVLLSTEERDDLAWDIAEQVVLPGLWLLPVVALALGLAIRRGLRPLHLLSADVHALDVAQASTLQARHPHAEFEAVVAAINILVARQQAALQQERALADEVAHELRTPLASLALLARALQGPLSETERQTSLQQMEADALRAGAVVSQLLVLARTSRVALAESSEPVALRPLAQRVVADYVPAAWNSGHTLAVSGDADPVVQGHPVLLELALRNLVENALRHTARGTEIEVQVGSSPAYAWLQVCDTGVPGGPSQAVDGLGLGHKIARRVAEVHGGQCEQVAAAQGGDGSPDRWQTCYRLTLAWGSPVGHG
jgi:two-component system sensor histidine kinase QseC|nr:ATP-binding protein [uncultured Albidiferax sp.]